MTIELLTKIITLTVIEYMIGAFLGNSFKPKDWDEEGKMFLAIVYIILIMVIIFNHNK